MLIAKIAVTGVRAASTKLGTLTSGMVGAKVQFTFDSNWEGLNKTAVFRCMDITKDVLNIDSEVTIPHEVLVRSGSPLYVGVYGTNADGDLVIPTRWATVGIVYSGADPSGDPSTERSPDVWEQLQDQINELKQQGADADAIKQAVEAYMAANPQTDELQNAVNVALAQAKESGSFDGPQGPAGPAGAPGKDGQPGEDGKDYVLTESDKTEIAEMAAELVEVPESGGIEVTGASVGQTIVVKAVDDNGKPTEWETADLPQGGGGSSTEYSLLKTVNITEAVNSIVVDLCGTYNELWLFFDMVKSDANAQLAIGVNTSNWYNGLVFGSANGALTTAGVYYAVHLKRLSGANLIFREDTSHGTYGFKTQNGTVNRRYADDNTNGISSLCICTMNPTTANYTAGTIKIWGC